MFSVDFNRITEEHIKGDWHVQSRIISRSDPSSIFARAHKHQFTNENYKARNGEERTGKWNIVRDKELLTRPYIHFEVEKVPVKALITKLLYSKDQKNAQLTIYFSTGLELVLLKNED